MFVLTQFIIDIWLFSLVIFCQKKSGTNQTSQLRSNELVLDIADTSIIFCHIILCDLYAHLLCDTVGANCGVLGKTVT